MTFEESLDKLTKIKEQLDREDITLDESVELYKESVELTKTCLDLLKSTEGKISVVKAEIDKLVEKPLENTEAPRIALLFVPISIAFHSVSLPS